LGDRHRDSDRDIDRDIDRDRHRDRDTGRERDRDREGKGKLERRNVISKTLRCARPRRIVQQNVELTVGRNSCIHRCAHTETQIISIIHPSYGWVTKLRHGA